MTPYSLTLARRCCLYSAAAYRADDRLIASATGLTDVRVETVGDNLAYAGTDENGTTILCFRGTATLGGWVEDAEVKLVPAMHGRIHAGFAAGIEFLWDWVTANVPENTPLIVTGHSLGGALATLAAEELIDSGAPVSALYTFGCPRVGDKEFAASCKAPHYRVLNGFDLVPNLPPPPWYEHSGTAWQLPDGAPLSESEWARAINDLLKGGIGCLVSRQAADHLIGAYQSGLSGVAAALDRSPRLAASWARGHLALGR